MADDDTSTHTEVPQNRVAKQHQENPYLKHIDRAPYELGSLIRQLPPNCSRSKPSEDEAQLARAASQHATNGANALLWGLEALGGILIDLSGSDEYYMDQSRLSAIGGLMQHLSVEIQFLQDTRADMKEIIVKASQGAKGGV